MQFRIFISSVQSEFADERARLKVYIEKSPLLRRFFSVFVFESDVPPQDRRTDEVYLEALGQCNIYLALVGDRYAGDDSVELFADRLEIYNPGSINPALTPEKLTERRINGRKLAVALSCSEPTIDRQVKIRKVRGLVEFRGAPKTGGYYVK